jgi:hypothetical protein
VIIQIQCKKNYLIQIYNSYYNTFYILLQKIVAKTFNSFSILLCTSSILLLLLLREEKPNTKITFTSMQLHIIKQLFIH